MNALEFVVACVRDFRVRPTPAALVHFRQADRARPQLLPSLSSVEHLDEDGCHRLEESPELTFHLFRSKRFGEVPSRYGTRPRVGERLIQLP